MDISILKSALPYHKKVRDYFAHDGKTWDYFSKIEENELKVEQMKLNLLKDTYAYTRETDNKLYKLIDEIAIEFQITHKTFLAYQIPKSFEYNASVIDLNDECLIIFSGDLFDLLNDLELKAVLAHELSHVLFYELENSSFETTDRIIGAILNSANEEAAYINTAKHFRQFTELYCDAGAYYIMKEPKILIAALIKITLGVNSINAEQYIEQTKEIFHHEIDLVTEGYSHPELFIRVQSILQFAENDFSMSGIEKYILGKLNIDELDLFAQEKLQDYTKTILHLILKPKWMRTTLCLSLASSYFPKYVHDVNVLLQKEFITIVEDSFTTSAKEYLCYVLYDFAKADIEIVLPALGWIVQVAEQLGIQKEMLQVFTKENSLSQKRASQMIADAMLVYNQLKEGEEEQIYE